MNLYNSITDFNHDIKDKAKKLAKIHSPDITKLNSYKINDKTIVYFKKSASKEIINRTITLVKKSMNNE